MANTERLMAIQHVMDAYNAVVDAQLGGDVTEAQKRVLVRAELALDRAHDLLIEDYNRASIEKIKRKAAALGRIVGQLKRTHAQLKKVAALVERAAQAVKLAASVLESAVRLAAL